MSYIYAELDENGKCKAVSELSGEVFKDTMIPLETFNEELLGKKYNNGLWEEVEEEVIVEEVNKSTDKITELENKLTEQSQLLNQILSLLQK